MDVLRVFVAGVNDVTVVTPAAGVEQAYDILVAGGVAPQKAADMAVGAAKQEMDPVAFARKFLLLRASVVR